MNMKIASRLELTDNSRIELFPIYIHEAGEGTFRVVRWGGKSRIATRRPGIDVIEMLRKGATIGQVKEELSRRYHHRTEEIVLTPLLTALQKANLIRRIDTQEIKSSRRDVTLRT